MRYTVVKENGNYLDGEAFEKVVDAVQCDKTNCVVAGYKVNILEVVIDDVDHCVVKVEVEGIDV